MTHESPSLFEQLVIERALSNLSDEDQGVFQEFVATTAQLSSLRGGIMNDGIVEAAIMLVPGARDVLTRAQEQVKKEQASTRINTA